MKDINELLSAANIARYKATQAKEFGRIEDFERLNDEASRIVQEILDLNRERD